MLICGSLISRLVTLAAFIVVLFVILHYTGAYQFIGNATANTPTPRSLDDLQTTLTNPAPRTSSSSSSSSDSFSSSSSSQRPAGPTKLPGFAEFISAVRDVATQSAPLRPSASLPYQHQHQFQRQLSSFTLPPSSPSSYFTTPRANYWHPASSTLTSRIVHLRSTLKQET